MKAIIETSLGEIEIELFDKETPLTVENFKSYAKAGFYDGTIFHRVINNFMIQGGGFNVDMEEELTDEPIQNEANKKNKNLKGTVAMARTMDPHSATSQFFINVVDNDFLNFKAKSEQGYGYCTFGKVTKGMKTIDKIKVVDTTSVMGHSDVPYEPVVINKVTIKE